MVTTLQDIRDNKELLVFGTVIVLAFVSRVNNFEIGDILERMNKKESLSRSDIEQNEKVINGNAVLLYSSTQRRMIMEANMLYQDRIFVSNFEYLPDYSTFYSFKYHRFTKFMNFL